MNERPTPETDHLENSLGEAARMSHPILWANSRKLERERNEARNEIQGWKNKWTCAIDMGARAELERDEAREEVKELIYIAERAIALAEIDYENDKFGVVSELRDQLQKIKKKTK